MIINNKRLGSGIVSVVLLALCGASSAFAATADNVRCDGCVGHRDLGKAAVSTSKIRSRAVSTGKIKDGAVTVDKVAPRLKNAIGTFCPPNQSVVGMDYDGNFVCEAVGTTNSTGFINGSDGTVSSTHVRTGDWSVTKSDTGFYRISIPEPNFLCGQPSAQLDVNPLVTIWDNGRVENSALAFINGRGCAPGVHVFFVKTMIDGASADADFSLMFVDPVARDPQP